MLEGLYALGRSLAAFFTFWPLTYALGATLIGILVGCMPGLSATLAIALLTTLTAPFVTVQFAGVCIEAVAPVTARAEPVIPSARPSSSAFTRASTLGLAPSICIDVVGVGVGVGAGSGVGATGVVDGRGTVPASSSLLLHATKPRTKVATRAPRNTFMTLLRKLDWRPWGRFPAQSIPEHRFVSTGMYRCSAATVAQGR